MLPGTDCPAVKGVAVGHIGQDALVLLVLRRIVAAFLVEPEEAVEDDHRAGGAQGHVTVGRRDVDRDLVQDGAFHSARHRASPDQLVEAVLVPVEPAGDVLRPFCDVGRTNSLVRLLGVFGLGLVNPWGFWQVGRAILAADQLPTGAD